VLKSKDRFEGVRIIGEGDIPDVVLELQSRLAESGVTGYILPNVSDTGSFLSKALNKDWCATVVEEQRVQSLKVEETMSKARELKTILCEVFSKKHQADHLHLQQITVSIRSNRKVSWTSVKKVLAKKFDVAPSSIDVQPRKYLDESKTMLGEMSSSESGIVKESAIELIYEACFGRPITPGDKKHYLNKHSNISSGETVKPACPKWILLVQSMFRDSRKGLITPFMNLPGENPVHLCDPDVFRSYYYSETLTTNSGDRRWSIQLAFKGQLALLQGAIPNLFMAENPVTKGGESDVLRLLDRLIQTPIHIIGYDPRSLAEFHLNLHKCLTKKIQSLSDTLGEEAVPFSGLYSAPLGITTHQFTEFAAAMYGEATGLIKLRLEKILSYASDEQGTLLIPCNIIPNYLDDLELSGLSYFSIADFLNGALSRHMGREGRTPRLLLLAGSRVSLEKSLYVRMLKTSFLELFHIKILNASLSAIVDNAMMAVQSQEWDSAYNLIGDLIESCGVHEVVVVASTSISLLRQHDSSRFQRVMGGDTISFIDLFAEYPEFCAELILSSHR